MAPGIETGADAGLQVGGGRNGFRIGAAKTLGASSVVFSADSRAQGEQERPQRPRRWAVRAEKKPTRPAVFTARSTCHETLNAKKAGHAGRQVGHETARTIVQKRGAKERDSNRWQWQCE